MAKLLPFRQKSVKELTVMTLPHSLGYPYEARLFTTTKIRKRSVAIGYI